MLIVVEIGSAHVLHVPLADAETSLVAADLRVVDEFLAGFVLAQEFISILFDRQDYLLVLQEH